jgi:membrane protein
MATEAKSSPSHLSLHDWGGALRELKDELQRDNVSAIAASLAFYGILAIFPALIALVSLYGLFFDPMDVARQMRPISQILPPSAAELINGQLQEVVSGADSSLRLGVFLSIAGLLWSVSSGVGALIKSVNRAYFQDETRGFLRLRALALVTTIAVIVFAIVTLAAVAVLPPLVERLGLPPFVNTLITWLRWPVLALLVILGLAFIYRYAPDHKEKPPFRWITPGSIAATTLWLLGSLAFSFYVTRFGKYNETYGALGAVIVLMLWLWLSAFSVLLGAELNAVLEKRAGRLQQRTPEMRTGRSPKMEEHPAPA